MLDPKSHLVESRNLRFCDAKPHEFQTNKQFLSRLYWIGGEEKITFLGYNFFNLFRLLF